MRPTTAAALCAQIGGTLVGDPEAPAARVATDTRGALREGDVFFGIIGPRFDGGAFAPGALASGASVVVTADSPASPPARGQAWVVVPDTLAALQALAAAERAAYDGPVVGITGSNGKTVVKEMLVAAIGDQLRVSASPASYNSQVGVALALLHARADVDVWIVECGVSERGEMARLERMVRPTCGLFVNVGDAHLEGFGNRETTASEKALLFARVGQDGWVAVPESESLAANALHGVGAPVCSVEMPPAAGASGVLATNRALATFAARRLGVSRELAERNLRGWSPLPMRLEISTTPRGVTLINDAYSADPVSMEAALVALTQEPGGGRTIAVLGEMAQLGARSEPAHAAIGRRVVELGIDVLVGVGAGGALMVRAARLAGMSSENAIEVASIQDAAAALESRAHRGDRVLLKASRPERLERVVGWLFESVAPARLEIDLGAVVANFEAVRSFVGPDVGVMPVVKSFGYGLDAVQVARALERSGAAALCVAYVDEAVELRLAGVTLPILVQNVMRNEVDKLVKYGASAQIGAPEQVGWVAREAERQARRTPVHLKLDTGMGRAGVHVDQAAAVAAAILAEPALSLDGLMTHFAAADDPSQDAFTAAQIEAFNAAVAACIAMGAAPRWVHACNSAGAVRFPSAHFNMVRLGIGLYGHGPRVRGGPAVHPVLRLTTRVVSIKQVPPGGSVGYGRTWRAGPDGARVALVAIGYNDGYPRALSNRGWMRVGTARLPVIGNVCMDVTMLDASAVATLKAGDEVVVYDDQDGPTVSEAAELAATIPYELLTRLAGRVLRVFRRGS